MIHNTQYAIRNTSFHRILFYFLLALLPTQLGLHFWPQWAMVLGRRIDYLSPTIHITDVLIVLILLFWFIELFPRITYHVLSIVYRRRALGIFTFLIFICINIFISSSRPVAIYSWLKVLEFMLLGLYIVKT
jgi:hypothetical protein